MNNYSYLTRLLNFIGVATFFFAFFMVIGGAFLLSKCNSQELNEHAPLAYASIDTDYYNNDVSEQISQAERQRMRAEWKAEHGDIPANLTPAGELQARQYTALKQAEIDGAKQ